MHKKFRISVDGRSYDVVVEEILGELGTLPTAALHPTEAPAVAAPAVAAPAVPAPAPTAAPASAGVGDEVAPLAGVVDSIEVKVGQTIAVGDKIAVIEAMKMKTEVFAKHSGTVTNIAVKAFQSVDGGQVLLTVA